VSRTEEGKVHGADSVIVTLVVIFVAMLIAYFGWWGPNHQPPTKPPENTAK